MTFSARLAARQAAWRTRGARVGWRATAHRVRELRARRRCQDPDDVWRCCANWQRTLCNKWNAREFVRKHGGPVPELYWAGAALSGAPFASLPARFVVRATSGASLHGVVAVADGRDLLRDDIASPAAIRARLRSRGLFGPPVRFLIEEFVLSGGEAVLPIEYKCHTFGPTVAAVQVVVRTSQEARHRYYATDWTPMPDPMCLHLAQDVVREPPRSLTQMLALASRLGAAYGTYVRVDTFDVDRGCVFNEFSAMPAGGADFTPYCDALFGRLWDEMARAQA